MEKQPEPARTPPEGEVEVHLTALTHGPYAVGRRDGQAVLVRGGAPGDLVRARVIRRHARYLIADLVEVLKCGPARRVAPCPFHPACGGCPWQQVNYDDQLAQKVESVRREVARIASGPDVVAGARPAPSEWSYRRRIRLHVDRRRRIGFMGAGSHDVVEITGCLVAEDRLSAAIPLARALIGRLRTPVVECEILSRGTLEGVVLVIASPGRLAAQDTREVKRFLTANPAVRGATVQGPGWSRSWGDVRVRQGDLGGGSIDIPPFAFIQVNEEANRLLVEAVVRATAPVPSFEMLELYAGTGNFTLALAPETARYHAVERDRGAVAALQRVLKGLPQAVVERSTAKEAISRLIVSEQRFDCVLVDPPRGGLADEIAGLLALKAPRLVYVSCDLATFIRDARPLISGGYTLGNVDLVDLFPQTFHIELVARFDLAGP